MSGPLSRKAIVKAVEHLRDVIHEWENMPPNLAPMQLWKGAHRKQVSSEVESAAAALFDLCNRMDVDVSAYDLVLVVDQFDDTFSAWGEQCQRNPDLADPSGSPEVWGAWQALLKVLPERKFPLPEPIGQLLNNKPPATRRYIAKAYGWYDDAGNPDEIKVQEEIIEPGKHFDPETWVHPSRKRFIADLEKKWVERGTRLASLSRVVKATERVAREKREAPETIEELIRQGVNSTQIVKMKKTTIAHVRAVAAELGLPLDGNMVSDVMRRGAKTDDEREIEEVAEKMRIDGLNSYSEMGADKYSRIRAMADDGIRPGDIQKALAESFPGLTHQQVVQVIGKPPSAPKKTPGRKPKASPDGPVEPVAEETATA
jgi:hypothetical protein